MAYHSLDIPWSTPTQVGLRKSPLPQNALQAIFPMKYGPMALSMAIWPLAMIHKKNLSIFHESVSIMNTLDKFT